MLCTIKDGVAHRWEVQSTVQVHCGTPLSNEDGFCSSTVLVVGDHLLNSGTFPSDAAVTHLYMHSNSRVSLVHVKKNSAEVKKRLVVYQSPAMDVTRYTLERPK